MKYNRPKMFNTRNEKYEKLKVEAYFTNKGLLLNLLKAQMSSRGKKVTLNKKYTELRKTF